MAGSGALQRECPQLQIGTWGCYNSRRPRCIVISSTHRPILRWCKKDAVAEELAVEHCSFYGDKTSKAVKGFFLNQVYRSWGHTAHRGWARLLDRRSLVQVPNAPRRRARADDRYNEENIMESYIHPESDQHIGSGPEIEFCLDTD